MLKIINSKVNIFTDLSLTHRQLLTVNTDNHKYNRTNFGNYVVFKPVACTVLVLVATGTSCRCKFILVT